MNNQTIQTKEDLIKALDNSERAQIQYVKDNVHGIIMPPEYNIEGRGYGIYNSTLNFNGYLKFDNLANMNLIQKTEWGLYLVQGLGFRNRLDSSDDITDKDAENNVYYKEEYAKLSRWNIFSEKYLAGDRIYKLLRTAKNDVLWKMKDDLKKQLEYVVDMKYSGSGNNFRINSITCENAFQSRLFYPTDEVIALYR